MATPQVITPDVDAALKRLCALPLVIKLQECLARHGAEARLVGGIVRDTIIAGHMPENPDLDMAMTMPPQSAMDALKDDGLRVIPTGIDHGTVTVFDARDKNLKIELTTLRRDISTDGRHAEVAFTRDWNADAARRDFTINALYLDCDGTLHDPMGGLADLAQGRVRFIGDASVRIQEDYLRMLRYFRFHARFGRGPGDADAMAAITRHAAQITSLSGERIAMEFDRILTLSGVFGPKEPFLELGQHIFKNGVDFEIYGKFLAVFDHMMTQAQRGRGVSRPKMPPHQNAAPSLMGRYAAFIRMGGHGAAAERLKMANHRRDALAYIASPISNINDSACIGDDDIALAKWAWEIAPNPHKPWASGALAERYILTMIRAGDAPDLQLAMRLMGWKPPEFPLKGQDLIDAGFEAGQGIGVVLTALEKYWIDHDFSPTRGDLLSVARGLDLDQISG